MGTLYSLNLLGWESYTPSPLDVILFGKKLCGFKEQLKRYAVGTHHHFYSKIKQAFLQLKKVQLYKNVRIPRVGHDFCKANL